MLVLSRKSGDSIVIGDSIVVTVLETNKKSTRLGITAPAHVRIRRQELEIRVDRLVVPTPKNPKSHFMGSRREHSADRWSKYPNA